MPGPNFAIYYATKAYVRSFSEALAQELAPLGVKVSCLCPGPVATGFQARAGFGFTGAMSSMKPAFVPASEVARQGYEGLMAGRRIVVPGAMNRILLALIRLTPRAVLMPALAYAQGSLGDEKKAALNGAAFLAESAGLRFRRLDLQNLAAAIHAGLQVDMVRTTQFAKVLVLDIGRRGERVGGASEPALHSRGFSFSERPFISSPKGAEAQKGAVS